MSYATTTLFSWLSLAMHKLAGVALTWSSLYVHLEACIRLRR